MKEEGLISKLEDLETPDIDLPGHRKALRAALINSDRFQRRTAMGWARILAPVAAAVALMAVFGFFNIIQPQLHIAQAREIASTDAHVQALMTEYGLAITEVQLQDGEAYVLLAPQPARGYSEGVVYDTDSASAPHSQSAASWKLTRLFGRMFPCPVDEHRTTPAPAGELPPDAEDSFPGYVLRVDLSSKKVSGFLEISYTVALSDIELQDAHFTEAVLPREIGGEEPDPDM